MVGGQAAGMGEQRCNGEAVDKKGNNIEQNIGEEVGLVRR
jgi:hypothetical protein